jgi:2-dehydropantoate 2-reductase
MRVAVLGAGAIGSYFGAKLATGGADVTLLARGAHLIALQERGLTIREDGSESHHRVPATDDPADVGPVDAVLFCVKSYDTATAAAGLGPILREGTAVISLQNGVDNEETIADVIGWPHVVGGAAYILAGIPGPGVVAAGGPRRIVVGEWAGGPPSDRVTALVDACHQGGIDATAASDVRAAKWEKFILLAAFSGMSATVRLGLGEIAAAPAARSMLRELMLEVWRVGRAAGVGLGDDIVDRQFALVLGQAPDATASLHHDLVAGRRMELEALQGAVLRIGRHHGIPTPWLAATYAILEPWARRNSRPLAERPRIPG